MSHYDSLGFAVEKTHAERYKAIVTLSPLYVNSLYTYLLSLQRHELITMGFTKGATPLAYLDHTFKHTTLDHLKEVFFTHCVINFLYKKISEHRIALASEPIIKEATLDLEQGGTYIFELICIAPPVKHDWKRLLFKAPTRKNYKDLDKQVEFFVQNEHERAQATQNHKIIATGDWVLFGMTLVDTEGKALLPGYSDKAWIKLGDEGVDRECYELFAGRQAGDKFVSNHSFFQEYIGNDLTTRYTLLVEIIEHISFHFFSLDQFKKQFKLKTGRDTHAKLIEVFSFRNDISQRRETIEAVFKLLLSNYPFVAPERITVRQQELVLRAMQSNPDYNVYKTQTDFRQKIRLLAEKQVKEHILIDHLAHDEGIQASDEDVIFYLNLTKRPRTKEFIYFDMPSFKAKGHETPIPAELVRYCCLQEKTLNHLISHLTKRA